MYVVKFFGFDDWEEQTVICKDRRELQDLIINYDENTFRLQSVSCIEDTLEAKHLYKKNPGLETGNSQRKENS